MTPACQWGLRGKKSQAQSKAAYIVTIKKSAATSGKHSKGEILKWMWDETRKDSSKNEYQT